MKKSKVICSALLLFVLVAFIEGCGGSSSSVDNSSPTGLALPGDGRDISHIDPIIITFDESMDIISLALGGDLASEDDGGAWSTSTNENDTLTITPTSEWTLGAGKTLIVDASGTSGNAMTQISLTFEVKRIFYVSTTGNDSNAGTWDAPLLTIGTAITAGAGTTSDVRVSAGTYSASLDLSEGVSLYGGYSAGDWALRDAGAYTTTIADPAATGGATNNPNRAVYADNTITTVTVIDGFSIQGGGGDHSSGIFAETGGSPTITNNTINGGSGTINSYGINNNSSSPIITSNTVSGGSSADTSYSIWNDNTSSPTISNNTIDGGSGVNNSHGIATNNSSPIITSNIIDGGSGADNSFGISNFFGASPDIQNNTINGGSGATNSYGFKNMGATPSITGNTISGGSATTTSYGIHNTFSSPTIDNNIVFTGDTATDNYCIYESDTTDPASVRNNDLYSCATALYYDENTTDITTIGGVNALVDTTVTDNINEDPQFVDIDGADDDITTMDDNDWHLTASTPTSVTTGGIDGGPGGENWGYTTDLDSVTRTGDNTTGWSMGSYEYD